MPEPWRRGFVVSGNAFEHFCMPSACKSCACWVTQLTNKHTNTCTHCMHCYVYVYAIKHVCTFQCVCVQSDMALHVDVYSFALFVLIDCMCICVYIYMCVYVSVWCMSSYMLTYDAMYVNVCPWSVLHTL